MTSPDANADTTSNQYNVHIDEGRGIVIGPNAHVEQHFYQEPVEPEVNLGEAEATYRQKVVDAYQWLDFGGFARPDLSLTNVPLEEVFVRLTLTVEKVMRELVPSEKPSQAGQREGQQRERMITVQEPNELGQALSNHLLIVGEPGAGKSTLLRWLAVTFAGGRQREPDRVGPSADADRLPVLVELGRLPGRYLQPEGGETPNWLQFLPDEYLSSQMAFIHTPPQLLTRALAEGRCLLLFDGLDEVADRQARARIARSLAELARLSPGNRLIIGSRPAGVSESEGTLHPQFQRCQIRRFTPEDAQQLFRFWYALDHHLTPEQQRDAADELYTKVQATPATLELATTPLLSTILLQIWRKESDLPERRVDLYERCCRDLIGQWEAHHGVTYQGVLAGKDWEDHLRLLLPLAYALHSQEQGTSITREELVRLLAKALQTAGYSNKQTDTIREAKQFLDALGLRSGLLQYMGNDRYSFPHLTFQEYLTARYIATQPHPDYIDLVMAHLHEAWWQQVHLLTIAHLGSGSAGARKASTLILTILRVYAPPNRILRPSKNRWLCLVGRLLPQVQLERRIAWILAREFELAAEGYAECVSDGTTPKVGTLLSAQAASLVRHLIYDRHRDRREEALLTAACQVSQHQSNKAVVNVLLEAALHAEDSDVRRQAGWKLGQVGAGNEAGRNALLEATVHATDADVRWDAALRLGEVGVGNEVVVNALLQAALHAENSNVQGDAVEVLGQVGMGNEAVVNALLEALHDADSDVRGRAVEVLGRVGADNEVVVNALLQAALHDADLSVRKWAAEVLGRVKAGNEAVVNALLEALHATDWSVRMKAALCLVQVGVGNEAVVNALLEALHDADSAVRWYAAQSLGEVRASKEAVVNALLKTALHDADWSVRMQAVEALVQVGAGNEAVVNALLHAADSRVRHDTVVRLGEVGASKEAVVNALLETALHDADWSVQVQAIGVLGWAGARSNKAAVNALLQALHAADSRVRRQAVEALGRVGVGNEVVVNALLEALHDADAGVRWNAAQYLVLVGVGNEAVVNALLETALHDTRRFMRKDVADCLIRVGVGSEVVVNALLEALHDADAGVRWNAAQYLVLVGVGNEVVVNVLLEALHATDASVRVSVVYCLGRVGVGSEAVVNALLQAVLHDADAGVRRQAAESLGRLGAGNEAVVNALLEALHAADPKVVMSHAEESLSRVGASNKATVRRVVLAALRDAQVVVSHAAASLGRLEIKNTIQLRLVLVALNRCLYHMDGGIRRSARVSIQQLLDGQPIPGYRWVPLRKQRVRHIAFWLVMALICLIATLLLGALDPNGFPVRILVVLAGIVSFIVVVVQVLGWMRLDLWKHS